MNSFDEQQYTEYTEADINDNKMYAVLAYIGVLWLVPFLTRKESPFVKYHLNQGIVFLIWSVISPVIFKLIRILPLVSGVVVSAVSLGVFVLMIMGIVNAATGKVEPLPIIGELNIIK